MRIVNGLICVALSIGWFIYAGRLEKSEIPAIVASPMIGASYVCGVLFVLIGAVNDLGFQLREMNRKKGGDSDNEAKSPPWKLKPVEQENPASERAKEVWPQEEEYFVKPKAMPQLRRSKSSEEK